MRPFAGKGLFGRVRPLVAGAVLLLGAFLLSPRVSAAPVCVDGVCYPSEEAAREAGVKVPGAPPAASGRRLALGYMDAEAFLAFLENRPAPADALEDHALGVVLLLVLIGGLAANLTPCVLPLVPVNLMIIGRGWRRGLLYGLGITLAYGTLGLAAAFGGLAFGRLQASVTFNLCVAAVFLLLAGAMLDLVRVPSFRLFRVTVGKDSLLKPFFLGLGAASLASACVEPILVATLLLTAKWFAAGKVWAVGLPFLLGLGMGLPYPFAAAGFSVLPKPGAWMVWVKRAFAAVFVLLAASFAGQALLVARGNAAAESRAAASVGHPGKRRLIAIGAPWCRNCRAMEQGTLRAPEVLKALKDWEVVPLEITSLDELKKFDELKGLDIKGLPAYVAIQCTP